MVNNLRKFLQIAQELEFVEVQIRFAPLGQNFPKEWRQWDDELFSENWGVIRNTLRAIESTPKPRTLIDLGVELGGITAPGCPLCREYVTRLWSNFINEFPNQRSYGFSVAYAPGRMGRLIEDLRRGGRVPPILAVDIYAEPVRIGPLMTELAADAAQHGVPRLNLLVQETYYADRGVYAELVRAARAANVTIRSIMQWPQTRGSGKKHISTGLTDQYLYLPAD